MHAWHGSESKSSSSWLEPIGFGLTRFKCVARETRLIDGYHAVLVVVAAATSSLVLLLHDAWTTICTLGPKFILKFYYAKRRFSITSKCRHIYGVQNVDEIKN
jgi:hypothetical protein